MGWEEGLGRGKRPEGPSLAWGLIGKASWASTWPGLCQEENGFIVRDAQAFSRFRLWNWSFALGGPGSWWKKPFGSELEFKAQLVAYLTLGT